MPGKGQRFTLAAPRPEVLGIAKIHAFNGETDGTQALNHKCLTTCVVRAKGRTANKLLSQLNDRA
jgi:hypothetical protein